MTEGEQIYAYAVELALARAKVEGDVKEGEPITLKLEREDMDAALDRMEEETGRTIPAFLRTGFYEAAGEPLTFHRES